MKCVYSKGFCKLCAQWLIYYNEVSPYIYSYLTSAIVNEFKARNFSGPRYIGKK
jgi:hypothetical protein